MSDERAAGRRMFSTQSRDAFFRREETDPGVARGGSESVEGMRRDAFPVRMGIDRGPDVLRRRRKKRERSQNVRCSGHAAVEVPPGLARRLSLSLARQRKNTHREQIEIVSV